MTTFTTSDGTKLSYTLHHADAPGTPVLLVMGFAVPGKAWRFLLPHLGAGQPVVWYDHRGSGESDAPSHRQRPYSMKRLAQDAVELMDHLGWREAHVVGVSMGGMVSQHIALDHAERVKTLTLMATHAGGMKNRMPTPTGALHFLRGLFIKGPARWDAIAELLFPKRFRDEAGQAWLHEALVHDLSPGPTPAGRFGQLRAVFGHDTRRRLSQLRVPTLVVSPSLDLLVRPRACRALHAGIPHADLLPVPDAGHGLIRQSGELLGTRIREHFARA